MSAARPVVITGIGVVSALGIGVEAFAAALFAGRTGCRPARRIEVPAGVHVAEVEGPDARRFVRSAVGRRIDRTSLLALAAARLALEDAGLPDDGATGPRGGLVLATMAGNVTETETFVERLHARGTGNPLVFPNLVLNAPLGYVSIELGVTGPTAMLTEQEASGEAAVQWGARRVATGAVDVCLAGASDELTAMLWTLRHETRTVSREPPRPFASDAAGPCPGEGAAVLALEPLDRAVARGARIYGRLVPDDGFSVPCPVHGWPRDPAVLAAGLAPRLAGADVVVASASGAPPLDRVEADALATALGAGAGGATARRAAAGQSSPLGGRAVDVATPGMEPAAVTAPRGLIGDFGAAGALAVAVAALAVARGAVPPCADTRWPPRRPELALVTGVAVQRLVRAAVVTGLSRGGVVRPVRIEAL